MAITAAGFLLTLLVRLPARWAAWLLPRAVQCHSLSGTLWRGRCAGLSAGGAELGDLDFALHPLQLLIARVAADVALQRADAQVRGSVAVGLGGIHARAVHLEWPLSHALLGGVPPGFRADIRAELPRIEWSGTRIRALEGQIDVHGLVDASGEALGDYRVTFPRTAGGDAAGRLHDLGGPLAVDATLTLGAGFVLEGMVAARPGAPQALADELRYLGTPDAAGRRPFSASGTF